MLVSKLIGDPVFKQKSVLERLICAFLDVPREQLWIQDRDIDENTLEKIKIAYHAYVDEKKPLEYILGYVEFLNKQFKIDERSLIPRPETEYMIQAVNEYIGKRRQEGNIKKNNVLIDVGTGSGVLGLSVLLHNSNFFTQAYLLEYYENTLSLAQENYQEKIKNEGEALQNVDIHVLQSDLIQVFLDKKIDFGVLENIILVANLPYIPDETFDNNVGDNVKNWEPRSAFVGGDDGLDFYRQMFVQINELTQTGNMKKGHFCMFLEMMTWQVDILCKEFDAQLHFEEVKTFHFNIRIVKATLK